MLNELDQAIEYYNADNISGAKKALKKIKANSFAKKKLEYSILLKEEKYKQSIFLGKQLLLATKDSKEIIEIANNMGRCYFAQSDVKNAEYYFEISLAEDDSVKNGATLIYLLQLYALREHFVNIEKWAPKALAWEKYSIDAQMLLLESASNVGAKALVEERVKRLYLDFDELDEEQFTAVIEYLRALDMQEVQDYACEKYEKRFNQIIVSHRVDSLLKHNKIDEALALLRKETKDLIGHQYLLGNTLQKNCDYDGAFEAWEKGGEAQKRENAKTVNGFRSITQRMFSDYKSIIPKLQNSAAEFKGEEGKNHVFVVGFPRSGTTLLDNVLDTHNDLLVLSERKILSATANEMKQFGKRYPKDIPTLSREELAILRRRYVEVITDEQGFKIPSSGIIIEKNPNFTNQIPFIKALYPQSKLIVCIRHPLDVCLSCLQQNFVINAYTAHLLVFKDIVNHYIEVFQLLERYELELGLEVLYVRYEDLVEDLETEIKKIYTYIGVAPNNSYLEFHNHAANKYVTSASRGQTNQALYQTSKYKWKKYEDKVAPYVDKLSYFIKKFGYE